MGVEQPGILAIWHDIVPEHAATTLDWYDAEHHFERLDVPGFLSVRRYHAVQGSPELFIRYETRDVAVLSSEHYLTRLNNPTPWTLRSQPHFRNNSRTVCVRKSQAGRAEGGFVATVRLDAGDVETVSGWDWTTMIGPVLGKRGVLGAELWEADPGRSTIATEEKLLRGSEDRYVGSVVVVHATDCAAADDALIAVLASLPSELARTAQAGIYALAFSATNSSV